MTDASADSRPRVWFAMPPSETSLECTPTYDDSRQIEVIEKSAYDALATERDELLRDKQHARECIGRAHSDIHQLRRELEQFKSGNTVTAVQLFRIENVRLRIALKEACDMIISEYCSHSGPCGDRRGCYVQKFAKDFPELFK